MRACGYSELRIVLRHSQPPQRHNKAGRWDRFGSATAISDATLLEWKARTVCKTSTSSGNVSSQGQCSSFNFILMFVYISLISASWRIQRNSPKYSSARGKAYSVGIWCPLRIIDWQVFSRNPLQDDVEEYIALTRTKNKAHITHGTLLLGK